MKFHMSCRRREPQRQDGAFFRLKTLRHVVVSVGNRCYLCRSLHKVADCLTGLCPAVQNAAGFRPACDFTRKVRFRPVRARAYAVQCPARYAVSLGAYPFLQPLVHVCERRDGKKTDGVVYTRGCQLPVAYLFWKIVADRFRGRLVRMVLRPVILVVAAFYLDAVQRIGVAHVAFVLIRRYAVSVALGFRNATQNRHRRLRIQRFQELYVYVAVHRNQRICKWVVPFNATYLEQLVRHHVAGNHAAVWGKQRYCTRVGAGLVLPSEVHRERLAYASPQYLDADAQTNRAFYQQRPYRLYAQTRVEAEVETELEDAYAAFSADCPEARHLRLLETDGAACRHVCIDVCLQRTLEILLVERQAGRHLRADSLRRQHQIRLGAEQSHKLRGYRLRVRTYVYLPALRIREVVPEFRVAVYLQKVPRVLGDFHVRPEARFHALVAYRYERIERRLVRVVEPHAFAHDAGLALYQEHVRKAQQKQNPARKRPTAVVRRRQQHAHARRKRLVRVLRLCRERKLVK